MKSSLFCKNLNSHSFLFALILIIVLICSAGKANIEKNFEEITSKLRCMTCQNQTIYSSDADFSLNIKKIVRKKLENKETNNEIINFLIYRYGEYILFEPQMSKQNIFLWVFPFLILAISLTFFIFRINKNS